MISVNGLLMEIAALTGYIKEWEQVDYTKRLAEIEADTAKVRARIASGNLVEVFTSTRDLMNLMASKQYYETIKQKTLDDLNARLAFCYEELGKRHVS